MNQLKAKQKYSCLPVMRPIRTRTRGSIDEVKPKQVINCLFTDVEKALIAKVHLLMAEAIKKKGKAERAGIMQAIGAEHQDLMIRWFICRMNGQIR